MIVGSGLDRFIELRGPTALRPRIPRPAIWFAGSGMVASIPLHRNASRTFWVEYALSANIRSGLVLGMRPFLLMIEMSAISPVKAPESCRCPAVVTRGMARHRESAAR